MLQCYTRCRSQGYTSWEIPEHEESCVRVREAVAKAQGHKMHRRCALYTVACRGRNAAGTLEGTPENKTPKKKIKSLGGISRNVQSAIKTAGSKADFLSPQELCQHLPV